MAWTSISTDDPQEDMVTPLWEVMWAVFERLVIVDGATIFGDSIATLGNAPPITNATPQYVTKASNAIPIILKVAPGVNWVTGDTVRVLGVGGNTAANGTWEIFVQDANTVWLIDSVGNGAFDEEPTGGVWREPVYLEEFSDPLVDIRPLVEFIINSQRASFPFWDAQFMRDEGILGVNLDEYDDINELLDDAGYPSGWNTLDYQEQIRTSIIQLRDVAEELRWYAVKAEATATNSAEFQSDVEANYEIAWDNVEDNDTEPAGVDELIWRGSFDAVNQCTDRYKVELDFDQPSRYLGAGFARILITESVSGAPAQGSGDAMPYTINGISGSVPASSTGYLNEEVFTVLAPGPGNTRVITMLTGTRSADYPFTNNTLPGIIIVEMGTPSLGSLVSLFWLDVSSVVTYG